MLEFNRRDIKAMIMGPKPPKGPEGKNVLWMDTHSAVPLLRVWLNERWTAVENTDSETIHIDFEGVKADVRELQSYFRQDRSIVVTNVDCRGGLLKLGNTQLLESELITFLGFDDRITALEQKETVKYTAGDNIIIEGDVISAIDTTYNNATEETNGLMSYQDKIKLNDLNNYVLPKASVSVLGGIKVGDTLTIDANGVLNALSSISIDDATISTTKTWSSNKISSELSDKQTTLTAGQNIVITNNTISAVIDAGFQVEVVQTLPESGEANTIYFVPKEDGANPDVYDEYMYINNTWEKIGSTEVDLSNYYNKTEVDTLLSGKQDKLTAGNNITINGTTISANDTTYSASDNIDITDNAIKAVGYRYNTTNSAFAEGDRDIVEGETTFIKSTATGLMSHAEGNNTKATGTASHAEGGSGSATGIQSHAEGSEGNAIGVNSHVEGRQAVTNGYASHAEGDGTETGGNYGSATSNPKTPDGRTTSAGDYAHAEGLATIAYGVASHAEGYKSFVRKNYSHAEGNTTVALGGSSHAEGNGCKTVGGGSHAEGQETTTNGYYSHSEGKKTVTFGDSSHAEGQNSVSRGVASHAEGNNTETGGNYTTNTKTAGNETGAGAYAHAEGNATIANGVSTHAEGYKTLAIGKNSHAEGAITITNGLVSHAEGRYTKTSCLAEHAQGSYNKSHTDDTADGNTANGIGTSGSRTIHSIGIGTAEDARKNAVEVMQNGDAYLLGVGGYDGVHIPSEAGYSDIKSLQAVIDDLQFKVIMLEPCPITMLKYKASSDMPQYIEQYIPNYSYGDYRSPEGYAVFSDLTIIPANAFSDVTYLYKIEIPEGVTDIETKAFYNCTLLEEVILPKSLGTIHSEAFYGCSNIYAVRYNGKIDEWNNITIDADVFTSTSVTKIICIDGTIDI